MYIANTVLGLSFAQVARMYRRDARTVSYSCRRIEDLRDDPDFDWYLGLIEAVIRHDLARAGAIRGGATA
ncbi:MAG: hypothetical protein RL291_1036 [Pseudomonadota bacterium]